LQQCWDFSACDGGAQAMLAALAALAIAASEQRLESRKS
jgi:hypothetical protein